MHHDLPPWHVNYPQGQRWLAGGVFEAIVHDLGELLRMPLSRDPSRGDRGFVLLPRGECLIG